jgi:hypothetical protein
MEEKKTTSVATPPNYYPKLVIKNNTNPNRFLNFPLIGPLVKVILLIPVFIFLWILSLGYLILWIITPFVILFTGKYWDTAYDFNVKYLKYYTKIMMYWYGLIDKYPGFSLSDDGLFELTVQKPEHPNRVLAFPVLGFLIRLVLVIPFAIWGNIVSQGASVAYFFTTFAVLFKKKYPESCYEFISDSLRLSNASSMYMTYLSDKYPSFKINMNHKNIKYLLIAAGALLMLANIVTQPSSNEYENDMPENGAMYDSTQDAAETYSDF